jgi:uncharacterized protein
MTKILPSYAVATDAVRRNARYAGSLAVAQLSRLADLLVDSEGSLSVEWTAGRNVAGRAQVQGHISGSLQLRCQRCLQPFQWDLDLNPELRLVYSEEEEARVLQDCEPYRVEDDRLPLRDMAEDEVLLAMPLMPRCKTCENTTQSEPPSEPLAPVDRPNPFAALKKLKL